MRSLGAASLLVLVACGPSGNKTTGDCKDSLVVGDLVITEVFADFKAPTGGTGADEGKEWFEIYNASDRPIELEGMRITHSRPDGSRAKGHTMKNVVIDAGQYFTLGNATQDLVPAYVDYGYGADLGDFFNSDGGKLVLGCDVEIDSATYESVKEGRSRQLTAATFPDYTLNDDPNSWCEAKDTEFETNNFGTPGGDNDCVPVIAGACNDGGVSRPVVLPMPGELIITEVMPNPASVSDTTGEWFEVKALVDVDLNGLGLDRAGDSSNPRIVESPDCLHVPAGGYAIFAKSLDPAMNGNLPADAIKGLFNFSLVDGTAATPGDVQILVGTTVIDSITWTSTRAGKTHALHPDFEDATANDSPSNFCDGSTVYNTNPANMTQTDSGTPGADNLTCTLLPPPGMCDPGTGAFRAIVKPTAGDLVITELLANAAGTDGSDAKVWFEVANINQTTPFDLNGLTVSRTGATATTITSAACIQVSPNGFALLARSTNAELNGGLDNVAATFGFTLPDSGDNRNISVLDGTTLLDMITYTATGVGGSSADGKSVQLDPDHFNITDNDLMNPTAGVVCQGTTAYGTEGNLGTPGAANVECP